MAFGKVRGGVGQAGSLRRVGNLVGNPPEAPVASGAQLDTLPLNLRGAQRNWM
jgi:hypothetical protein